ncbi:MAG: ABC transporter ATP-binding protein [Halobacteria archaeon]
MSIEVRDVSVELGGHRILESVSLRVEDGTFVGLLGPNGSGKSTLLRTIYRMHRPRSGEVALDGKSVHAMEPREVARRLAVVAQEASVEFDYSVWEMVMLGRAPHKAAFDPDNSEDHRLVAEALQRVGMERFAERSFPALSGGEKQRVLIARALAQQADHLLLDEPTNHLDVRYQLEVLELLSGLGVTVLAALHDLNLAAAYCDQAHILAGGKIYASGTPDEAIEPRVIRSVFGVDAALVTHPGNGRRHIVPTLPSPSSGNTPRREP